MTVRRLPLGLVFGLVFGLMFGLVGAGLWLVQSVPAGRDAAATAAMSSHAIVPAAPIARHEPDDRNGGWRGLLPLGLLLAAIAAASRPRPASWRRTDGSRAAPTVRGPALGSRAPPAFG